jgi:hypothetical protein
VSLHASISVVEDFLGIRRETVDGELAWWLDYFDGCIYWHFLAGDDHSLVKVACSHEPHLGALPTVELEGRYSGDYQVGKLNTGDAVLILKPEGVLRSIYFVCITKQRSGALSLSTTLGHIGGEA